MKRWALLLAAGLATAGLLGAGSARAWDLAQAAAPYKGTSITVVGLDRPRYAAARPLTPEFEADLARV